MAEDDFRFSLGAPALNFVATVASRGSEPRERIPDAAAFGRWLRASGFPVGPADPTAAEYRDALALREAISRTGRALLRGEHPARADIEIINAAAARKERYNSQFNLLTLSRVTSPPRHPVRAALAEIAESAIDVFSDERDRLTLCNDERCAALMLSQSRGPKRRWCSMETCGNRNKVASYRSRTGKQTSSTVQR